jgi:two-component system response regulator AtoC
MGSRAGVLIIDDDPSVCRTLSPVLAESFRVHVAASGEDGLAEFDRVRPDLVLLDLMLPQMSGLAVLRALKRSSADLPVIMMTGFADVQTAVQAIKLGALDYLQKPLDGQVVLRRVEQAVARPPAAPGPARAQVIGESAAMKRVWRLIERFGPTDIPILLQGETGTGKGLIAEAIHQLSNRSQRPFVAIDCATIPPDLAESELFGYEDGAFTGAGKRKRGRVAFADRGTLFLDEIGTLAVATQCKLLTLFERQNFLPLGARNVEPTHLDVRFISATNLPLLHAVDEGTFRADLYHRLNGVTLELPPLRDRPDDITSLARHFVGEFARRQGKAGVEVSADALDLLQQYSWPGNVRELQRVLSVAVVTACGALTADDLPDQLRIMTRSRAAHIHEELQGTSPAQHSGTNRTTPINLREIKEWAGREAQKRVILELQSRTNISRQDLARMLGVDAKTLRSRLKEMSSQTSKIRSAS